MVILLMMAQSLLSESVSLDIKKLQVVRPEVDQDTDREQ